MSLLNLPTDNNISLPTISPIIGQKRPPPTLLPAFEPQSSSPGFLRPSKRQACSAPSRDEKFLNRYPTPIPSSTTGILSSPSPLYHDRSNQSYHPRSVLSERNPLSAVLTIILPENGEIIKLGRSSKSSNFQLSTSRLISRVHVEARFIAATTPLEPNCIEIKCRGWNGLKLHCSGQTWDLAKNDTFLSESEFSDVLIDTHDSRVLISWPERYQDSLMGSLSDFGDDEYTPTNKKNEFNIHGADISSSPIRSCFRVESPVSPCPRRRNPSVIVAGNQDSDTPDVVQVYEDIPPSPLNTPVYGNSSPTKSLKSVSAYSSNQESELSEIDSEIFDEENDPWVDSVGLNNDKLNARIISTARRNSPIHENESSLEATHCLSLTGYSDTIDHTVNQLAFSLKSSVPLSELYLQLPASLKNTPSLEPEKPESKALTKYKFQQLLNSSPCIGEISREGKDAAGKPLESEYYYILDEDQDEARRTAVQGLRKPSLRSCRKKHKLKQYYWKKPKTP
ncbi:hypothetical protein Golomagni_01581 [Golovinomyces magnicellulatus]|nr:hypothetical protein Golomagni_01581 [Golovinomyces magnicellulatus]